jgi:hypothetical protein
MSLTADIAAARRKLRIEVCPMSVGEWAHTYETLGVTLGHGAYTPWTLRQQSRFIEAILLGASPGPILVGRRTPALGAQDIWCVLAGRMALATTFHFMGILRDANGGTLPPLILAATPLLPSLAGARWQSFTETQRIVFKRTPIAAYVFTCDDGDFHKTYRNLLDYACYAFTFNEGKARHG